MDYGKTLHLPETEFPMRGNLPKREPEFIKFWEDKDIYKKRLALRQGGKQFILHDGPPYAMVTCIWVMPLTKLLRTSS